jgi:hypothetical protein
LVGDLHYFLENSSRVRKNKNNNNKNNKNYTMSTAEVEVLRERNRELEMILESLENHQEPVPQQLRKLQTVTSVDYDEDENGGCMWNCGTLPEKDEETNKAYIRGEMIKQDRDQELIRHDSALRIQGFVRGILVREEFRTMIREECATVIQAAARGMISREKVRKQLPVLERARKKTIETNRKALNRERKIREKLEKKEEMKRLKQEKLKRKMKSNKLNQKEHSNI